MSTNIATELAPLHARALEQLRLAAEREQATCDAVAAELGDGALATLRVARQGHPTPTHERLAERLVESTDAHGLLAETIRRQLAREAAAWRALVQEHGDEAEVRLRMAAEDHGRQCGARLADEHGRGAGGPGAVLDLLSTGLLEGLPCETAGRVERESAEAVSWSHAECPYRRPWDDAGVDFTLACNVVSAWRRGFATGCDSGIEYRRPLSLAVGDGRCEHELVERRD